MTEDIIEKSIGGFKRWHAVVCTLVFLVNFPLVWFELSIIFFAPKQNFTCSDSSLGKCSSKCPSREFDTRVFTETIVSKWDLVCEREYLTQVAQMIVMLGILLGNVTFGFFSDRIGRRKPLLVAVTVQVITGVSITVVPWFWLFMTMRFLCAMFTGGTVLIAFVLTLEVVGAKYRAPFGILFEISYYLGHSALGGIAYFLRHWQHLQLFISLWSVSLLSYYCLLPESPRWLLAMDKKEQLIEMLEKTAIYNKLPIENIRQDVMSTPPLIKFHAGNPWDLVKYPKLRIRTLTIIFNWIVLGLVFFGVAQYMSRIEGNIFLNVAISGLVQIPSNLAVIYLLECLGRKKTLGIMYLCTSIACLLLIVMPVEPVWPKTVLGSIGMLGISASFAVTAVFSGELFPTVLRNIGIGVTSMFGKAAAMISPFVATSDENTWLAPFILGVLPLIAMLSLLLLPETLNTKMPDTVEEAERFGTEAS